MGYSSDLVGDLKYEIQVLEGAFKVLGLLENKRSLKTCKSLYRSFLEKESHGFTSEATLEEFVKQWEIKYSEKCRTRSVCIAWHIEDVKAVNPKLSDEECSIILDYVIETHDATVGINWDVLEGAVKWYIMTKKKKK